MVVEERYAVGLNVVLSGSKAEIEALMSIDNVHVLIKDLTDGRTLVDEVLATKQFSIGLRHPVWGFARDNLNEL